MANFHGSGEEPTTTQGHSSVDLRAERALNPVGNCSHEAISSSPKRNKATKNWGLIFFHFTQKILKPDIATFQLSIFCDSIPWFYLLSLPKELLRHIMRKRRGQGWKEAKKETWKQETWKEWVNILLQNTKERDQVLSQQWDSSSSTLVIQSEV